MIPDPFPYEEDAPCAGVDPAVFWPPDTADGNPGKAYPERDYLEALCWGCIARVDCREYAITTKATGWWGGTSEYDRREIRRERRLQGIADRISDRREEPEATG